MFIPGSKLKGALQGDKVMIRLLSYKKGSSEEGEVVSLLEANASELIGIAEITKRGAFFIPDTMNGMSIILEGKLNKIKNGDKIIAKIIKRGKSHRDMKVKLIKSFGDSNFAYACAESILSANKITEKFPVEVTEEALSLLNKEISEKELAYREDLRNEVIFTIDGADSKDLDDAVSLEKYNDFYVLGVHIADVSHYVKEKTNLDCEAFKRGTSIYYANKVIPMLPKALSNGICSLNPLEDRLSFSVIITLSKEGKIIDYDFKKSIITSKVKGVYSEVNQILSGEASEEIFKKYKSVLHIIPIMKELSDILYKNRKKRGSPDIDTVESKILINESDEIYDVIPRERGESEKIIEEFMLTANEAAALFAKKLEIPFIYRIHEYPDSEKLLTLKNTLKALGIKSDSIKDNPEPHILAQILDDVKNQKIYPIISKQILRSMAKAKYSENPIGHYGLALNDYTHFTSPIRRYPDLAIHRILSDLVTKKYSVSEIKKKYRDFCKKAASVSTEAEINAINIERSCEDCYKAEYIKNHLGEKFTGTITSVTSFGFYVMLPNTIEGFVRIESLPCGDYFYDGLMEIKEIYGQKTYRVGDVISVICANASVNDGNVDFVLSD